MKNININGAAWDSIFLTAAKVLTMLFGIVLTKIMSTGLSLEEYGTYSQVNIVTSICTSCILLGLSDAVNYFFNKKDGAITDEQRYKIINTIFFIEILFGIILAILVILGRNFISAYFSNIRLNNILIVASAIPMLANLIYFYQVLYISSGKAKLMSLYNLVMMVLKIISAYIAVYLIGDIIWIYAVLVILDILQLLVFKIVLKKHSVVVNPFKISKSYIYPILSYSLPMGVYAMTSTLTRDIDKLVIGRLVGTEYLAIYTNCSKILPFDFLVVSFATVLMPHIVKYVTAKDKEQTVKLFSSYMKIGYYSVWTLGLAVLISPKAMISFLYSDEYTVGTAIFVIYIIDSMLRFASMHLLLTAAGKSKHIMMYSIIALLGNIILNIVMFYSIGNLGPAVATLIIAIIYSWLVLGKTMHVIGARWKEIFNIKEISVFLLSLAVIWTIAFGINSGLVYFGLHRYLAMIISIGVFCSAVLAVNFKKIFGTLKEINQFRI